MREVLRHQRRRTEFCILSHIMTHLRLVFGIAIVFSFFGILLVQKEIQAVGREEAVYHFSIGIMQIGRWLS